MDIIFFRHGIAVEREDWKGEDDDRPLTDEGSTRTQQAARGLRSLLDQPHLILSSPLLRARQTAELARQALKTDAKIEITEDLLPGASPERVLTGLARVTQNAVVLCVGHEPHISTTVSAMISGKTMASLEIKKAGACCVRFSSHAKAGAGTLLWLLLPKTLRALGR
jgi:phosphohistidine phosphatase